jgi:hypothetical protein
MKVLLCPLYPHQSDAPRCSLARVTNTHARTDPRGSQVRSLCGSFPRSGDAIHGFCAAWAPVLPFKRIHDAVPDKTQPTRARSSGRPARGQGASGATAAFTELAGAPGDPRGSSANVKHWLRAEVMADAEFDSGFSGQYCVVNMSVKLGQQRVNRSAPEHPRLLERNQLDEAVRPAGPRVREGLASTFNPKVAGSIPARPSKTQDFRQGWQRM